jgi:hypothetical protein
MAEYNLYGEVGKMESKWYVVITNVAGNCILDELQVGIVADYDLDTEMEVISEHDTEESAAVACAQYAKSSGIPEFGTLVMLSMACPQCENREIDSLLMDDQDYCTCQKCGKAYDPLETRKPGASTPS